MLFTVPLLRNKVQKKIRDHFIKMLLIYVLNCNSKSQCRRSETGLRQVLFYIHVLQRFYIHQKMIFLHRSTTTANYILPIDRDEMFFYIQRKFQEKNKTKQKSLCIFMHNKPTVTAHHTTCYNNNAAL